MRYLACAVAVIAAGFAFAPAASAAHLGSVIDGTGNPWDGGLLVASPVENAATTIAQFMTRRQVYLRCPSPDEWAYLYAASAPNAAGVTRFVFGRPLNYADLSPDTCSTLEAYAAAPVKPTVCPQTTYTPQTTYSDVTTWVTVKKKVKGKLRTVRVRVTKTVATTTVVATTANVPCTLIPPQPLPLYPLQPAEHYAVNAYAIWTLTHETIHLSGAMDEAATNCYGLQWVAYAAEQLGADVDDANAIMGWLATSYYPTLQAAAPDYWSADCHQDGPLDLSPGDGHWP